jgi:inhibitor of cysteine peptidase
VADIELTMRDRDRTVPVGIGERVVLSLPENPTTGVRWSVPASDALELVADENRPSGEGIGAGGMRVLTFRPKRPGRIRVRLLRQQAWESEETADATFEIELDAHDG